MLAHPFLIQKPFNLDTEAAQWVEWTLSALSTKQKLGQLFCLIAMNGDEAEIDRILDVMEPGGIMYRPLPLEQAINFARLLRERVPLPMLIAANLEKACK